MTSLFAGSIIFVYLFSCITIINYGGFRDDQKISLIYLTNIGMTYTGIIGAKYSLILLVLMMYLYEEFFQIYDTYKSLIVTKWLYKICDFCYLSVFKNYILWMVLALTLESNIVESYVGNYVWICHVLSFLCFIICMHKLYAQKYKIETITKMFERFNENAYKKIELTDDNVKKVMGLVVAIEDKSYFIRENSYSWFSIEFIKYRIFKRKKTKKRENTNVRKFYIRNIFKHPIRTLRKIIKYLMSIPKNVMNRIKISIIKVKSAFRGYSTLEMQYIRTIGILSARNKFVIRRKLFEIIYSKIFFQSVKEYYINNDYNKKNYYKEYLLYQYLQVTFTKINGVPFESFAKAFKKEKMSQWNINSVAVAVLGMNSNGIYPKRLELYKSIFEEYNVDANKVLKLANEIKTKKITMLP